jgi:hypothetical protein
MREGYHRRIHFVAIPMVVLVVVVVELVVVVPADLDCPGNGAHHGQMITP